MTTTEIDQWLWSVSATAAWEWFKLQSQHPHTSLYLYHAPGKLEVGANKPAGYELATGQRLGPNGTVDQMKLRIYDVARRLPILTPEMVGEKKGKR